MANLRVRMKDGSERDMTQKVYDLLGFKRKPKIIGKAEQVEELSEIEKIKADLRAQKAANTVVEPTLTLAPLEEVLVEKKKGGRPPKQKQDEI